MAKRSKGFKVEQLPLHMQAIARHKLAGGGDDAASEALFYANQPQGNLVALGVSRIPALCNCGLERGERSDHESGCASAYATVPQPPLPKPQMNKTETAYAAALELRLKAGDILSYGFEAISLSIGAASEETKRGAWYTPDFLVLVETCLGAKKGGGCVVVELHEVKGHWREAARVRLKAAAKMYPHFRFVAVKRDDYGWDTEVFGGR